MTLPERFSIKLPLIFKGAGQAVSHVPAPPQLLAAAPPHLPSEQSGVQQAWPEQTCPTGQIPVHVPPQVSEAPPHLPAQSGVQQIPPDKQAW